MPNDNPAISFKVRHLECGVWDDSGIKMVSLSNEEHGMGVPRDSDFVNFSVEQIPTVIGWLTEIYNKLNGTTA